MQVSVNGDIGNGTKEPTKSTKFFATTNNGKDFLFDLAFKGSIKFVSGEENDEENAMLQLV